MHLFQGPLIFLLVLNTLIFKKLLNIRFLVKILTFMLSMTDNFSKIPYKYQQNYII